MKAKRRAAAVLPLLIAQLKSCDGVRGVIAFLHRGVGQVKGRDVN
jgi:hypothetical protein